ncbi:MAG: hypothetical protein E7278_10970 [Lachnospiraceae bacterium]|jgi:hypothetical protein|nr:hypothetical protein [Lachnospiraceae bacterium]
MSYDMNPVWEPYYSELDTDKRKALLDEISAAQEDDGANEFRQRIFYYRYVDQKDPKHQIDRFLGTACMFRDFAANRSIFSVFSKKQVIKYGNELGFNQIASLSGKEKACLYREYKHALRRYFESCMSGNYHSLFGMVQPEDKVRIAAAKNDIATMTTGIAKLFHLEDSFTLWMEAGNDLLAELEQEA